MNLRINLKRKMYDSNDEIFDTPSAKRKKLIASVTVVVAVILLACLTAFLLKTFVFESIPVSGDSMNPTLSGGVYELNDDNTVKKTLAKGDTLILDKVAKIKRGDIIVFDKHGEKNLVKRVIAVAGDTVTIKNGKVYLNGEELVEDYTMGSTYAYGGPSYDETEITIVVESGHVYCLGDNRENSLDSRSIGTISLDDVIGKCILIANADGKLRKP